MFTHKRFREGSKRFRTASVAAAFLGAAGCAVENGETDLASSQQDLVSGCGRDFVSLGDRSLTGASTALQGETVATHAVDYDGDGHLDVVSIGRPVLDPLAKASGLLLYPIGFLRGDGHGKLAAPIEQTLRAYTMLSVTFADINGDGLTDVFYQSQHNDYQEVLRNTDGTWGATSTIAAASSCSFTRGGGYETSRTVADLDGDGRADVRLSLVSSDASGADHGTVILRGTASGLGAASCTKVATNDAFGDTWFALRHDVLGDFNGDGKRDLAGYTGSRALRAYYDVESASPTGDPNVLGFAHSPGAYGAIGGDFDGDGIADVADTSARSVTIYYGSKTAPLSRRDEFRGLPTDIVNAGLGSFIGGDFGGKGRRGIVFFSYAVPVVAGARVTPTICQDGSGTLYRFDSRAPIVDKRADLVGAGDFDEDGRDDIVLRVPGSIVSSVRVAPRYVVLGK